ncbi:MAG: RIP metalloprotease RseP [Candidatus Krumholzibacteria bacterium]|jgi:regulator of sigma E protease|nr:RIP metalloprotease RseP [Candidatus Krumholzibacteria bacterium]MDP6669015.1 RIP metalloprotease RseP [Candidatus Krumholzibacteria bacterium]MDP6796546.1 RIP metalloprotease RseP [Candidatus Krumholzibacteria bacterium]MDP7021733.1 RIP metalloprotease RseP [Candidatus Krumholzibacteria bacterium]
MLMTLFAGIFTIGLIVFVHEMGHYLMARLSGIHIHRFSIGFGPVLYRFHRWNTEWALSLIPLGGYVRIAGMMEATLEGPDMDETELHEQQLFRNKGRFSRLSVLLGGPLANLLLALLLLFSVFLASGDPILPTTTLDEIPEESVAAQAGLMEGDRILLAKGQNLANWNALLELLPNEGPVSLNLRVQRGERTLAFTLEADEGEFLGLIPLVDNRVGKVLRGGPADEIGLCRGDRIVKVNGEEVRAFNEIAERINVSAGSPVALVWLREGERFEASVTPREDSLPGSGGDSIGRIFFEPYYERRDLGVPASFQRAIAGVSYTVRGTLLFLGKLLSGGLGSDAVGGPIQIFKYAGQSAAWGLGTLLTFIAFFSTQLFLFNLLPIPALDGGHLLLMLPEFVGIKISETWRLRLTQAGTLILIGIMILVVFQDIRQLLG